jgi:adenylate cyclase
LSEASDREAPLQTQPPANPAESRPARLFARLKHLKGTLVAIAAGGAVLSGLIGYWTTYRTVRDAVAPVTVARNLPADAGPLSIVVLPFTNQTGDPQKAYIADGLTSSITADLSRIRDAFIVPVSSALTYRDKPAPVRQIGQELGVRFVLQGSVLANGNKLRINAQLADAQSGAQKWTETFEGDLADLFALQDQVTARIGNSIGNQIVILAARDSQSRKSGAKVADLILRANAMGLNPQSLQNWKDVEALLRRALVADPGNATATLELAQALLVQAFNFGGLLKDDVREKLIAEGGALALTAQSMDPDNPQVYGALVMQAWFQGDASAALRYEERRVALDPRDPGAYNDLAVLYYRLGQPAKAIELLNKALGLYPKGFDVIFVNLAVSYFMLGDYAGAATWSQKAIDTNTGLDDGYSLLAMAYSQQGDESKATATVAEVRRKFPDLKARTLSPRECVSAPWCQFLRTKYLPAWRKARLP